MSLEFGIDDKIFATGKKEDESMELWLKNKGLCLGYITKQILKI